MYRTHGFRRSGAVSLLFSSLLALDGLLTGCGTHAGTDPDNGVRGPGAGDPGGQNPGGGQPGGEQPGTKIPAAPPTLIVSARDEIPESLQQALSAAAELDGDGLERAYPAPSPEQVPSICPPLPAWI